MQNLKHITLILLSLLIISGCGKKKEQQILDLQAKNAELAMQFDQKDSLMNELMNLMNDIERNLSDITAREKVITDAPSDEKRMNVDVRNKIMDDIILINNIIEENKKKLALLREQLKKSDINIAGLQENIQLLVGRIEGKEQEIAVLKDELVRLNFKISALNSTVDTLREATAVQSRVISQQDALIGEMNIIWYVTGTKKDLTEKAIIEKAGGLFSGEMVMSEVINPDYFSTADMRKLSKIDFKAKKAELVTVHPEGSYKFIEENEMITGLEILNSGEFWKSSRFLVIMTR
jgi:hypothetical protein